MLAYELSNHCNNIATLCEPVSSLLRALLASSK